MLENLINIDSIPVNIAIYKKQDNDFIFVDFNKKAELTEKIDKKSLLNKRLTEVFPSVKEYGLFDVLLQVYETSQSEVFESAFYEDDRISGWRKNEISKLENGNIIVFYSDKTIEKELEAHGLKLEEQLSETEALLEQQKSTFHEIIEHTDAISVQGYNQDHEVVYWNKGSENLYGYTAKEAIGKKLEELIIPKDIQSIVYDDVENAIYNDVAIPSSELTLKHKDGSDVFVYSHHAMVRNTANKQIEMYCIDIDLNEIKKLQRELTQEKNFVNTILDVIPDLVWIKDLKGKYLKCNPKFEQFYGAKESEILDKTDFDFVGKELATFFRKNDKLALESKKSRKNEEYLRFADKSHEGLFETIKTPMKDGEGNIIGVLGISRDINDRKKKEEQLKIYANHDILTGLVNRALFMDRLKNLLQQRLVEGMYHSVLFVDLDRFKEVNDTLGHSIGDKVLIECANRITKSVRKGDTVARLGGDEFTVLIEHIHSPDEAKIIAQKIVSILREPLKINNHNIQITASIGIAISPTDSVTHDGLLNCADKAMYRAKAKFKDRYEFYSIELE